ncbi:uncharacterized protein K452DRAFT_330039 [Aplosporella prunicola CBS 121167]|uniref:NADH-ubiquinone oxidoreductase chain 3 n=1 Tax=Aplosporella prunicola CBS 121167 TaxID=1176127 RepID=A0A6A6AYC9_9PEZI|nr:uncharacterized protein K452DRAFT_330039 [Aplosporella prunicola CBS 121167]KAF2135787.1 hypothetical protein K452DRAFT_330039 [Aplosporella prunicola CBS 121167]
MQTFTYFTAFIFIVATLLLSLNFTLAPHFPYLKKRDPFECGYIGFQMTRLPFNISFFLYALLFLLFDLEILLAYPFALSIFINTIFGLITVLVFFLLLTIGFVFELGKEALTIKSKLANISIIPGSILRMSKLSIPNNNRLTLS